MWHSMWVDPIGFFLELEDRMYTPHHHLFLIHKLHSEYETRMAHNATVLVLVYLFSFMNSAALKKIVQFFQTPIGTVPSQLTNHSFG